MPDVALTQPKVDNSKLNMSNSDASFASRMGEAERIVRRRVSKQALTQDQFDALVSFTYSSGGRGAAKVLAYVDDGNFKAAASGITGAIYMTIRTKKGSKRVIARGLISRRAEESAPFRDSAK